MTSEEIITRMGEIEQRAAEIETTLETPEADLDALNEEARQLITEKAQLEEQLEELRKAARKAEEDRKAVENGAGEVKENVQEEKTMTLEELRSSKEYVDAFANYIKTGKDEEVRTLLTKNAADGGQVPVPTLVDDIVRHAWENENILARVKKTGFQGNVKVAFERSADGAYIHGEGTSAPTEEALQLGIVEIKPENIKKWITISDEMIEATGEGFLRYVYEELAYQVMKKLSYEVVGDIKNCAYTSHQATAVGIPVLKKDPGIATIAEGAAMLSDEATNVCVILNPLTKPEFFKAYAAANFAIDPFQGLPVVFSGALDAFSTLSENGVYGIIADLSGEQVNFPSGEGLKIIKDEYSLAEQDLVKIVGRVFAGHAVVAPGRFVKLTKEAAAVTT